MKQEYDKIMTEFLKMPAYELITREELPDVQSTGYLLRHKKSGARVMLIENEDDNKVFNIAFRTTPFNSTGVAHIMEHSVLCGSEKYPTKDPFVELVKGSMNTFLNAMTYPDKTMYPVASCNDTDFSNLMHVYLDAVFHPNIYHKEEIFRQEGWSYQLENEEDPITINGVVYNEMKGAFSSPDSVVEREMLNALFPDNTYHYESGGDPACIPQLTYEEFLDFHRKFYHPANSYLYLYGKMDFAAHLDWIDREYLVNYEKIAVDSAITMQKPFAAMQKVTRNYSISTEDSLDNATYLSYGAVIGSSVDTRLANAFAVLEYVLLEAPGAPLKEALLEAGIGSDIQGSYDSSTAQPVFSITAKEAEREDEERFLEVIRSSLADIVSKKLDPKAILAAVNLMEFRFREADYGGYPKGLIYGMDVFDSWLYDEDKPFEYLKALGDYAFLKTQTDTGYFEDLIRTYLLENTHTALVMLLPEKGLAAKEEDALAAKLAEMKAGMSEEQIRRIVENTKALRAFQETPSPQEELETIPMLSREDMKKESMPLSNRMVRAEGGESCESGESRKGSSRNGAWVLAHDYDANGIAYFTLLFDASKVPVEDLPYLGILRGVLGFVDTEHFSYGDLSNEINSRTGGITAGVSVYPDINRPDKVRLAFGMQVRTLFDELPFCFEMLREILLTSNLRQEKRLHDLINKMKSRTGTALQSSGSATAATRCQSHYSAYSALNDAIMGIGGYRTLQEHAENFEQKSALLSEKLESILRILLSGNFLVSYTGESGKAEEISRLAGQLQEAIREKVGCGCGDGEALESRSESGVAGMTADSRDSAAGEKCEKANGKRCGEDAGTDCVADPAQWISYYPDLELTPAREGFKTPGNVQYVARGGNFRKAGFAYTGAMKVLRTIMSYEYLWSNIRVIGGAYGCSGSFSRNGDAVFASYRDPHLARTNEVYEGIPEYLESFTVDDRDMTKYVIGTMSDMDIPLSPSMKGNRSLSAFLCGLTLEQLQLERNQVLSITQEDIRALAEPIRAVLAQNCLCVLGNEARIEKAAELFDRMELLQ